MITIPFISIIIPCRNEELYIGECLESVVTNDYPKNQMEVLIADGASTDRTTEIIAQYCKQYPFIRLLCNDDKITPKALNLCIKQARGDVIIRLDAHAKYTPTYFTQLVEGLQKYPADNVGGIKKILSRQNRFIDTLIIKAMVSIFGVGNAHFKVSSDKVRQVDTVFGGCYKKEIFEKIGFFNEKLPRGQDMEFNQRLIKAGGKIFMIPNIVCYYYARTEFKKFLKYNYANGMWAILPFIHASVTPISPRHLVPLVFTFFLLVSAILGFVNSFFWYILGAILIAHFSASIFFASKIALQERKINYLIGMPFIFFLLHFSYGLGSIVGVYKLILNKIFNINVTNLENRV